MTRVAADLVQRIASLGGGPIGGGWTAHFLARGYDVASYLHDPREEAGFRKVVDTAWISLETLGLAEGASRARLRITCDLAEAVGDAEFVQESAPEDLRIKQAFYEQDVFRMLDQVMFADVFAVVGRQHDQGPVVDSHRFQFVEQRADRGVDVGDRGVVLIGHPRDQIPRNWARARHDGEIQPIE